MELSKYSYHAQEENSTINTCESSSKTPNTNGKVRGSSNKIKTIRIIHELFLEKVLPNGIDTLKKSLLECDTSSVAAAALLPHISNKVYSCSH